MEITLPNGKPGFQDDGAAATENPEHEILMLVSAMIAQGRHFEKEANVITMVRQAIMVRHQIYKTAKEELALLAAKERQEADDRETANIRAFLEKSNEVNPQRPAA